MGVTGRGAVRAAARSLFWRLRQLLLGDEWIDVKVTDPPPKDPHEPDRKATTVRPGKSGKL